MKRASYRHAIEWIARTDSAADTDALDQRCVSELVTSLLVADLFSVSEERVGRDVVAFRKKNMSDFYGKPTECEPAGL